MRSSLFRREVVEAQAVKSIGSAVLLRPVPMRLAAAGTGIIGILLVCLITCCEYTRKTHVKGQIEPSSGAIRAVAQQYGTVLNRSVGDGALVRKGQLLFELSSERRGGPAGGVDARIDVALLERRQLLQQELALQTQQLERRFASLKQRSELIARETNRLDQEKALQSERVRRAYDMRARYQQLRLKGFVSEPQMANIDNDATEQQSRLHALDRARFGLAGEALQNQQETTEVKSQIALNATQSERTRATLDQETAEHQGRARTAIVAPADGILTAVTTEVGQTVQAGTVMGTIIPEGSKLEAVLLAPSNAIGFAEPGQEVMLRLASFPYQKYGELSGRITSVDRSPIMPAQPSGSAAGEALYRIRVSLPLQSMQIHGKHKLFYPGTEVSGDILQERRTLLAWIVDPIISAGGWREAAR
jgi:membrane fusion protein